MDGTRRSLALLAALAAATALAQPSALELRPQDIRWTSAPPDIAPGAQSALLTGAPERAEPYVVRVRLARDGLVRPHRHPDTRYITVLSGTLYAGRGTTIGRSHATALGAGSFYVVPAGTVHYAWAPDGVTEYQEYGVGPTGHEVR